MHSLRVARVRALSASPAALGFCAGRNEARGFVRAPSRPSERRPVGYRPECSPPPPPQRHCCRLGGRPSPQRRQPKAAGNATGTPPTRAAVGYPAGRASLTFDPHAPRASCAHSGPRRPTHSHTRRRLLRCTPAGAAFATLRPRVLPRADGRLHDRAAGPPRTAFRRGRPGVRPTRNGPAEDSQKPTRSTHRHRSHGYAGSVRRRTSPTQ